MATHVALAFSQNIDLSTAVYELTNQLRRQVRNQAMDLMLIFNTLHYAPEELLKLLRENFKEPKIVGSSANGIISSERISLRGIVVMAFVSDDTYFSTGFVTNVAHQNMYQAGTLLGKNAIQQFGQHPRKAFVYFGDDLTEINGMLVQSLQSVFGSFFPLLGASISDYFQSKKSFQYCNDYVLTNGIVGFLLGGRMSIGVGNRHGWKPLGRPRDINRTKGNIIYLIDEQAAVKIYDDYFGNEALSLRTTARSPISVLYPLGIYLSGEKEYLLRNVIAVQNNGSLLCQGEVPEGTEAHIMINNKDACVQAAKEAALEAQKQLGERGAVAVLVIESFTRLKFLGRSAFKEIEAIKEVFGNDTPVAGMYVHGEIYPSGVFNEKNIIHFQNESISVIAIG